MTFLKNIENEEHPERTQEGFLTYKYSVPTKRRFNNTNHPMLHVLNIEYY